ncbi:MAG TPA: TonB family protein [Chthoniobacterales bacterium]|nr:TonB family protein [Chthoniobacterales bacterium]
MTRDARFWRNVALIFAVHLALLLAFARASRYEDRPNLQSIVWLNAAEAAAGATTAPAAAEPSAAPRATPKSEEMPSPTPARSEIVMPPPTPTATVPPKPSPSPTAKPSPKPSEKPTPKPSPKKSETANPTAKPTPKPTAKPTAKASPKKEKAAEEQSKPVEEKKAANKESKPAASDKPGDKSSAAGTGPGGAKSSELAWYGTMLHDRFYKAWQQPTSSVASGAKMSTIVKIRIEKDGRVSKFAIVKSSGNVVVDESVTAIAQKVTQVDPLPEGLTKNAFYEVKIDFELNAEK